MKKIQTIAIALLLTLNSACQNKNKTMNREPKFKWEEMSNAPEGYPIEVYKGGIGGVSLTNGLTAGNNGGWGAAGSGSSYGEKTLPHYIDCIWVSYAEDCMYKIDCDIDYDKLLALFKEGYQDWDFFFGNGEYKKETYNAILVGFAPGGVVVIWAFGAGKSVEIGRYKGTKYEVPKEEIAKMDPSGYTIFDPEFRKMIMTSPDIVPLAMQNNPKPIPYGLWDSYRTRYMWRPVVEVQEKGILIEVSFSMFNGENESLFDKSLIENKFDKRAIPSGFGIGWRDIEGQGYGGEIDFDEKEITVAFKEIYKDNPKAEVELYFTINEANNFVTVMLKLGDTKIRLPKTKVKVYKSEVLTIEKK